MNDPRHLTVEEVVRLHALVVERTGGATELRDRGVLESAVAQPQRTFGGEELYPTSATKRRPWLTRS